MKLCLLRRGGRFGIQRLPRHLKECFRAVSLHKLHPGGILLKFRDLRRAAEGIPEKRGDHRVVLIHPHEIPRGCQKDRVLSQPRCGVHREGTLSKALDPGGFHEKFPLKVSPAEPRHHPRKIAPQLQTVPAEGQALRLLPEFQARLRAPRLEALHLVFAAHSSTLISFTRSCIHMPLRTSRIPTTALIVSRPFTVK